MDFLQVEDYNSFINAQLLGAWLEGDYSRMEDTEAMASGYIYSNLSARYDLAAEFAKSGRERNPTLLRWVLSLSVYFLHNTVASTDIPERVAKNYDDVRKEIAAVASGKAATDLAPLVSEDGKAKTHLRWGYSPRRSHNPFA